MNTVIFLFAEIEFDLAETALVTAWMVKFTAFVMVGSLFGSVLGIMESFVVLMEWIESAKTWVDRKGRRRVAVSEMVVKRNEIWVFKAGDRGVDSLEGKNTGTEV